MRKPGLCWNCGEKKAEVQIMLTDMNGTLLDSGQFCKECVKQPLKDLTFSIEE